MPWPWSDAAGYCAGLALNGHTWRVPSLNELASTVDESGSPAVSGGSKSTIFPNIQNCTDKTTGAELYYWANEQDVGTSFSWGLNYCDGFTAFNLPVDEGGLYPLAVEVAAIANKSVDGFVAWDTFLPGDLADIHLDACQALLVPNADIGKFMEAYKAIFK